MRLVRFLPVLALLVGLPAWGQTAPAIPALHRGVNLSSWMANAPRQPVFARDFDQIKRAGFDHVRLPFNPEYYGFHLSEDGNDKFQVDFTALDRALAMADQYNVPVILDMHPEHGFVDTLERHAWAEKQFVALWQVIAERYKTRSSANLVFEILNEPQYYKSEDVWNKLAARSVAAIRAISPDRVIIIGSPHGSDIDGLNALQTTDDPRVIYAFHFYEPYLVTHQGIHMGFDNKAIRYFRNMPYPSDLATEGAATYAPDAPNFHMASAELAEYRHAPWNADHIKSRIDVAQAWANAHHVRVICGEFGVLRNHIDPASRYGWIHDTRSAMDADDIGWEVWDYADIFGITMPVGNSTTDPVDGSVRLDDPEKGSHKFEALALSALGLHP